MRNKIIILISTIILLPSCKRTSFSTKKEIAEIQASTHENNNYRISWATDTPVTEESIESGLTQQQAVQMSLLIDQSIKIQLEELGVKKADLAQAGFLTNPSVGTLFQPPRTPNSKTYIDAGIQFTLSDFWQVPLRKKVAAKQLAIVSINVLKSINTAIAGVKTAYNTYLLEEAKLKTTEEIAKNINLTRDAIYSRQVAGYTSDFDRYFADTMVGEWEVKLLEQKTRLTNAHVALRNFIGLTINNEPLNLNEKLNKEYDTIPKIQELIKYGMEHDPQIQIARLQIKQAEHQRSLEKSKILDDVKFGIEYSRNTDGTSQTGPSIGLSLPIFDTNSAQIERTNRLRNKAEQELSSAQFTLEQEVHELYNTLTAAQEKIKIYKTVIIPTKQKALTYTQNYTSSLQTSVITLLTSHIELYKKELELHDAYFAQLQALVKLEQAIGGTIQNITKKLKIRSS